MNTIMHKNSALYDSWNQTVFATDEFGRDKTRRNNSSILWTHMNGDSEVWAGKAFYSPNWKCPGAVQINKNDIRVIYRIDPRLSPRSTAYWDSYFAISERWWNRLHYSCFYTLYPFGTYQYGGMGWTWISGVNTQCDKCSVVQLRATSFRSCDPWLKAPFSNQQVLVE